MREADVTKLVQEARGEAYDRARAILADELTDELVARARASLAAPAPASGEGWYVFGVVRGDEVTAPSGTSLVSERGLAAVVREVPLAEYGEEALRENLNDIAWLEDAARRHEAVLDELLRATTVIPLRLCTIYRSEAAVRDMLAAERAELLEALGRLAGRTEWGVKAFRSASPVADAEPQGGGAYMQARVREASSRRNADASVTEAFERLAALAVEALANPLQRRELTGREDEMVLNGVYLVEDAEEAPFRGAVEELNASAEELSFELTGPWPPYNFVKRSVDAAR